jgi:hypothetical protein
MLPQLRLAFSYFLPRETDRLARSAAGLHGAKKLTASAVAAEDYSRGEGLDAWAAARLESLWGGDGYGDL